MLLGLTASFPHARSPPTEAGNEHVLSCAPCLHRSASSALNRWRFSACGDLEWVPLRREYPTSADAYELLEECGRGVSATVSCRGPPLALSAALLGGSHCRARRMVPAGRQRMGSATRGQAYIGFFCWQVWRALCKPFDEIVAVKLMDLETVNCSLVTAKHDHGAAFAKRCCSSCGPHRELRAQEALTHTPCEPCRTTS